MEERKICYIGRPSYQKNTFFLLDVVKLASQLNPLLKFQLLGVGYYSPDLERMQSIISDNHLEGKIELYPWLDHEETLKYVEGCQLYLTVARYEGLPLSVLEAMALGKPIIASDVTGNRDCVIDGYNGFLLPMDAKLFAEKICYYAEHDEEVMRMGMNSRLLFEQKFLIDKRINMLEKIYMDIVGKDFKKSIALPGTGGGNCSVIIVAHEAQPDNLWRAAA